MYLLKMHVDEIAIPGGMPTFIYSCRDFWNNTDLNRAVYYLQ